MNEKIEYSDPPLGTSPNRMFIEKKKMLAEASTLIGLLLLD